MIPFIKAAHRDLRDLAAENQMAVTSLTPLTGRWSTLAQKGFHSLSSGSVSNVMRGWMTLPMGIVALLAYRIDKALGKRGDTIGYVLVLRKSPQET